MIMSIIVYFKSVFFFYLWKYVHYTLKMLGCFDPTLGQIWTNPAIGLNFVITF